MKQDKRLGYEVPRIDVIVFDAKDIITTSGFAGGELPLGPTPVASVEPAVSQDGIENVEEEIF